MKIGKIAAMLLAGTGTLFCSCNDRIETDSPTVSMTWGNEIRAVLSCVGDVQTRSHNVYMYDVRWDEGDQIYVKDAVGQHAKYMLVDGEDTTEGVFRQNSYETVALSGAIEAYSPAGLGESMVWPAVMDENYDTPMYSTKESISEGDEPLKFKSLGSVVNLVFNSQTQGTTLQSIVLSADQPLSGAFTVDAEGKAVLADGANGTVTLDFGAEGMAFTSPAAYSFYLYAPAGDYTNLTATFNVVERKPYVCNLGTKTLHHNAVEKFSVSGNFQAYTVTFNTRGWAKAGTEPASQQVLYGASTKKPADPVSHDKTVSFAGWYKDEARTAAWDFDNDKVTEDITLYARWTKREESGDTTIIYGDNIPDSSTGIFDDVKISFPEGHRDIYEDGGRINIDATHGMEFSYVPKNYFVTRVSIITYYGGEIWCHEGKDWVDDYEENSCTWSNENGAQSVTFYGQINDLQRIEVSSCTVKDV